MVRKRAADAVSSQWPAGPGGRQDHRQATTRARSWENRRVTATFLAPAHTAPVVRPSLSPSPALSPAAGGGGIW